MKIQKKIKQQGFSLLELVIVVAIIGILTSIALPSYFDQVRKARRTDAMDSLLDCAAAQARYFTTQSPSTYFSQADALAAANGFCNSDGINLNSKEQFYVLTVAQDNPNNCTTNGTFWCFTIVATPAPGNSQVNDSLCELFRVDHRGNRTAEGTINAIPGSDTTASCWGS